MNLIDNCPICRERNELAKYKGELMCMLCAKDEMIKNGSVQREIEHHHA